MCFIIPFTDDPYAPPLVAPEHGIDCFKLVRRTKTPGLYYSLFQDYPYKELEQQPTVFLQSLPFTTESLSLRRIDSGYHSYSSYDRAFLELMCCTPVYRRAIAIVRCIIPRGSNYYRNLSPEYQEYVSSSIILLGEES